MGDEPKTLPPVEEIPGVAGGTSAIASATAPFIFVNAIPNFGFNEGIACLTLEAHRYNSINQQVFVDRVIVGHLRLTPGAYLHLKNTMDKIVEMIAPAANIDRNLIN
jgi:hypothetical protein